MLGRLCARYLTSRGWLTLEPGMLDFYRQHGVLVLDDCALVPHASLARMLKPDERAVPINARVLPPNTSPMVGRVYAGPNEAAHPPRYVTCADGSWVSYVTAGNVDAQPKPITLNAWARWVRAAKARPQNVDRTRLVEVTTGESA